MSAEKRWINNWWDCWSKLEDSWSNNFLLIVKNAVLDVLSINNEKYNFVNFTDLENDKTKVIISQTIDEVLKVLKSLWELNLEDWIKYFNLWILLFKLQKFQSTKKYLLKALEKWIPEYFKKLAEKYVTFCDIKLLLEDNAQD